MSFFPRVLIAALVASSAFAAPANRIAGAVDATRTRAISGNVHRQARTQFSRGPVAASKQLDHVMLYIKPSKAQQQELDTLLVDQQNPSSASFHKWLTPEEFGNRFGLNNSDYSKIVAWLAGQGLTVHPRARASNWVAFSGTAAQVGKTLRTSIENFEIDGEKHFANATDPQVPEALADLVAGFGGLSDFEPKPQARLATPQYNIGTSHYLVPEDWSTIYNVTPLYQAGFDGTGQSIAIVGTSDISLADLRTFKTRHNLPANDPKLIPYGADPGFNGAQLEGNLDLEWSSAIAPKATIYFVYGPSFTTALSVAINGNYAPVISVSYGACEVDFSPVSYRAMVQQANAQGITVLVSSGDSGGSCDPQGSLPYSTFGRSVAFPAALPEVTSIGGTQFAEGTGNYWAATNSPNNGSALGYIPEAVWNESDAFGLGAGGGGVSRLYPRPAWQTGPGVPNDQFRHVPDISASAAASHDGYYVTYLGGGAIVGGTSASSPSLAGVIALLNQYQVAKGFLKTPGLGNINPQLYRLAQRAPSSFHDITVGDNIVPCLQGTADCTTGKYGAAAGPGYDEATGLGSINANNLITQWNTATSNPVITVTLSSARATLNDTVQVTAQVTAGAGAGTPTGTVDFVFSNVALGSAPLVNGMATISAPLYLVAATGTVTISALYSGDAVFNSAGASGKVTVTIPTTGASVLLSAATVVFPQPADAQGLSWTANISVREVAGVAANITGFSIDGVAQPLAQYIPAPQILPRGTVTVSVVFRNLAVPVTKVFSFTGVDAQGNSFTRQVSQLFVSVPTYVYGNVTATPSVVTQNTAADPACQWPVQLNIDDQGGYLSTSINGLFAGGLNLTSQIPAIFGTARVSPFSGLQGTVCFGNLKAPSSNNITVTYADGNTQDVTVSFAPPPAVPNVLTVSPANANLAVATAAGTKPSSTNIAVSLSDKTQSWTASIFPQNRTTGWLTLSQSSGTGNGTITLTANGTGYGPGAYKATIVIQATNAAPQTVNVPVTMLLGGSTTTSIIGAGNPANYQTIGVPGMAFSVFGANLAASTIASSTSPLTYLLGGVSATVNGIPAPLLYVSPTQVNIQIPYEVGAGPAILGINNNGQVAGFSFTMAPAAPAIYVDAVNGIAPLGIVPQGGSLAMYVIGTGDVSASLETAFASNTTGTTYKPLLPVSVTVAGQPAFLLYSGIPRGLLGTTQINFTVPASVPTGIQPVVVTVNGVASKAASILVQAAAVPSSASRIE